MNLNWQKATDEGDYEQICSLLEKGEDINSLDRYGQSALMNAAHRGDARTVKLLVEQGANLDITAKYNLSALMLAVITGHSDIVRILVNAGASTEIKGNGAEFDCTPVEYARKHGKNEIVYILANEG